MSRVKKSEMLLQRKLFEQWNGLISGYVFEISEHNYAVKEWILSFFCDSDRRDKVVNLLHKKSIFGSLTLVPLYDVLCLSMVFKELLEHSRFNQYFVLFYHLQRNHTTDYSLDIVSSRSFFCQTLKTTKRDTRLWTVCELEWPTESSFQ